MRRCFPVLLGVYSVFLDGSRKLVDFLSQHSWKPGSCGDFWGSTWAMLRPRRGDVGPVKQGVFCGFPLPCQDGRCRGSKKEAVLSVEVVLGSTCSDGAPS